jgi:hypothetical protein
MIKYTILEKLFILKYALIGVDVSDLTFLGKVKLYVSYWIFIFIMDNTYINKYVCNSFTVTFSSGSSTIPTEKVISAFFLSAIKQSLEDKNLLQQFIRGL